MHDEPDDTKVPLPQIAANYLQIHGNPMPWSFRKVYNAVLTGAVPAERASVCWMITIGTIRRLPVIIAELDAARHRPVILSTTQSVAA